MTQASAAPEQGTLEGLRAQNRAYRALCASLEATQAIQTEKGRSHHEAITSLESERQANAVLTDEVDRLQAQLAERERELAEAGAIIKELADDLEGEMKDRYCLGNGEPHPALKHKYDRDMGPVNAARAFLHAPSAPSSES